MSNFTQQHVASSREIVSIALTYQTDFFGIVPLVQETSYCNSTPSASLEVPQQLSLGGER